MNTNPDLEAELEYLAEQYNLVILREIGAEPIYHLMSMTDAYSQMLGSWEPREDAH